MSIRNLCTLSHCGSNQLLLSNGADSRTVEIRQFFQPWEQLVFQVQITVSFSQCEGNQLVLGDCEDSRRMEMSQLFRTTYIPIASLCTVSLSQCESESNQLVLCDCEETEEELFLEWVDVELVLNRSNGRLLPLVASVRIGRLWLVVVAVCDATCGAIYEVSDAIGVAQLVFFLCLSKENIVTLD